MKSMSISVIFDWIPDKYRIFYKSTGLDQLFRHARMLDDSMEIIDNDFLYLTQESSFLDREWDIRKPRFLIFCTKTGSKEGQINPSWMEHAAILYTDEPFHKVFREFLDIFDKYYAWYEQCLNIIIENKDVSDLLDYAATFLYNPIAGFDEFYREVGAMKAVRVELGFQRYAPAVGNLGVALARVAVFL